MSVGGMVGVVSGGGVVGCPCGLGLARRRQLALISMFAYISQRQNGPLRRTKYPCAWFRTSSTRGDRWGPPKVLPNKDILNPIPIPIRMYTVHPYWRIYPTDRRLAADLLSKNLGTAKFQQFQRYVLGLPAGKPIRTLVTRVVSSWL